ncbi:hypothetical protein HDV00_010020 [Rhizophlyctis rosea]|nr:hypothetical protein HDV00_010020 [Rhizophlyctis rosea]
MTSVTAGSNTTTGPGISANAIGGATTLPALTDRVVSLDPTGTEKENVEKIIKSKWRSTPVTPSKKKRKEGEGDMRGMRVFPILSVHKAASTFPMREVRKGEGVKKHVQFNPTTRFLLSYHDRAVRDEERKRAYEEAAHQIAVANDKKFDWSIVRPLSRDPEFARYIQGLMDRGSRNGTPSHFPTSTSSLPLPPSRASRSTLALSRQSSFRSSRPTTTQTTSSQSTSTTPSTPQRRPSQSQRLVLPTLAGHRGLISRGAGGGGVGEGSWQDLRKAVEGSVFRMRRTGKGGGKEGEGQEEEEYVFGRPEGIDEDTGDQFHKAFEEIEALGTKVHEKSAVADTDKVAFAGGKKVKTPFSPGTQSRTGSSKSSITHPTSADTTPLKSKSKRENPTELHHYDILATGRAGRAQLSATLKSRRQDRLEACKTVEGHRQIGKLVDMDLGANVKYGPSRKPRPVWDGVVPYMCMGLLERRGDMAVPRKSIIIKRLPRYKDAPKTLLTHFRALRTNPNSHHHQPPPTKPQTFQPLNDTVPRVQAYIASNPLNASLSVLYQSRSHPLNMSRRNSGDVAGIAANIFGDEEDGVRKGRVRREKSRVGLGSRGVRFAA